MPEPERLLLAHVNAFHVTRHDIAHHREHLVLAARAELGLDFERHVEVILDRAFAAARDEHQLGNAGGDRLFNRILDQRLVDDRQHFLGARLGCRQEPRPQSRHRKYRFGNSAHHVLIHQAVSAIPLHPVS